MAYSFINNINTFANLQIFEELKPEDPEEAESGLVIGTMDEGSAVERPEGVRKILNRAKPKLFKKYLLESNVLVYDLNTADLDEVEAAVRMLKAENFEEPKTLVVISSVHVWDETPVKMVPREPGDPETEEDEPPEAAEETLEDPSAEVSAEDAKNQSQLS
jgi:hypothetical protein